MQYKDADTSEITFLEVAYAKSGTANHKPGKSGTANHKPGKFETLPANHWDNSHWSESCRDIKKREKRGLSRKLKVSYLHLIFRLIDVLYYIWTFPKYIILIIKIYW